MSDRGHGQTNGNGARRNGGVARTLQDTELGKVLTTIRLTPVQRRIARHILESPTETAFSSSVELAEAIGVSQPSVTRFANAIGFGGYPEFVRALRQALFEEGIARTEPSAEEGLDKWEVAIERSVDDLHRLRDSLRGNADLQEAIRGLASSMPLPVYGVRLSLGLTDLFTQLAAKIHPSVWHLDGRGSQVLDQIFQAREAGATWLLAIILPRYPREAERVLAAAARAGLRVVMVTDSPLSPLAGQADLVLSAPVNSSLVFDTHVAPTQLVAILLEGMVDADPERAQHRLDAFEQLAVDEGLFTPDQ